MPAPNFLVIGAGKSGTTSLYHYLRQHPQVFMCPVKEPNFFALEGREPDPCRQWRAGPEVTDWDSYIRLFDGVGNARAIGEASTSYLYTPQAPERIHHYLPDVKIVAILRNPVDRFYSSFVMMLQDNSSTVTKSDDVLRIIEQRTSDEFRHALNGGFYAMHLARYFGRFEARQIRVFLLEDLRRNEREILDDLFHFLNVETHAAVSTPIFNAGGLYRNAFVRALMGKPNPIRFAVRRWLPGPMRGRLSESLRKRVLVRPPPLPRPLRNLLLEEYREDIARLEQLIHRDLSHWLT